MTIRKIAVLLVLPSLFAFSSSLPPAHVHTVYSHDADHPTTEEVLTTSEATPSATPPNQILLKMQARVIAVYWAIPLLKPPNPRKKAPSPIPTLKGMKYLHTLRAAALHNPHRAPLLPARKP